MKINRLISALALFASLPSALASNHGSFWESLIVLRGLIPPYGGDMAHVIDAIFLGWMFIAVGIGAGKKAKHMKGAVIALVVGLYVGLMSYLYTTGIVIFQSVYAVLFGSLIGALATAYALKFIMFGLFGDLTGWRKNLTIVLALLLAFGVVGTIIYEPLQSVEKNSPQEEETAETIEQVSEASMGLVPILLVILAVGGIAHKRSGPGGGGSSPFSAQNFPRKRLLADQAEAVAHEAEEKKEAEVEQAVAQEAEQVATAEGELISEAATEIQELDQLEAWLKSTRDTVASYVKSLQGYRDWMDKNKVTELPPERQQAFEQISRAFKGYMENILKELLDISTSDTSQKSQQTQDQMEKLQKDLEGYYEYIENYEKWEKHVKEDLDKCEAIEVNVFAEEKLVIDKDPTVNKVLSSAAGFMKLQQAIPAFKNTYDVQKKEIDEIKQRVEAKQKEIKLREKYVLEQHEALLSSFKHVSNVASDTRSKLRPIGLNLGEALEKIDPKEAEKTLHVLSEALGQVSSLKTVVQERENIEEQYVNAVKQIPPLLSIEQQLLDQEQTKLTELIQSANTLLSVTEVHQKIGGFVVEFITHPPKNLTKENASQELLQLNNKIFKYLNPLQNKLGADVFSQFKQAATDAKNACETHIESIIERTQPAVQNFQSTGTGGK